MNISLPFADMDPIPVVAVPPFLGGLIYGLTEEDNLLELETCIVGAEVLAPEIHFALNRVTHGGKNDDLQALLQIAIIILQLPNVLAPCKDM
jgi:hypothetical protein